MAEIIERRYLLIQKYCGLRDKKGHDYAMSQFSQTEKDEMFNYLVSCATPENYDKSSVDGGYVIPKAL